MQCHIFVGTVDPADAVKNVRRFLPLYFLSGKYLRENRKRHTGDLSAVVGRVEFIMKVDDKNVLLKKRKQLDFFHIGNIYKGILVQ